MEKEWKSGEAIWHMKQAERNALDVAAMNKLNEIIDVATLRQRVQELEQQLTEVRRAERERCAKACEAFSEDDDAMDRQVKAQCAKLIRAME